MPAHPSPTPSPTPLINTAQIHQFHPLTHGLFPAADEWLRTHWPEILIATAIGAGIVLLLNVARRLGQRLCRYDRAGTGWPTIVGRAIGRTGNPFMIALAARLVEGYAGAPHQVDATVAFLFTVAAVFQCATWARELILGAVERRTAAEGAALGSAISLIRVLVTFALFAIALIVVLDNVGVNVTGLVAGLGVGGIAIGLAAQGIFADLFAALAIIFDRPFRRGDVIQYDQSGGSVEEIGLKSTRIRSGTGEERIISNKQLLDKEIQNITRREYRRIAFTLGLACWTPAERMRAVPDMLRAIVEGAGARFVHAGFTCFGASSYDFQLEFDSPSPDFDPFYRARHEVGLAIIERFAAEGIDLAYPARVNFPPPAAAMPPAADPPPAPIGEAAR